LSKIEVNAIEPQCGTTLTIGASDTSIAGIGTVNWDTTKKTAAFTAVSGRGYFVDTTSAAITVTLPASPSAGNIVAVSDYAQNARTNNITIARNGSNIQGNATDLDIERNGASLTLLYVDATKGWIVVSTGDEEESKPITQFITATGGTITTSGDFKIHTFTGPGTFCVSCGGNSLGSNTVDYLVVAGGGSGGTAANGDAAGGGGAGGARMSSGAASGCYTASPLGACVSALGVSAQAYPITVGGGGSASPYSPGCTTSNPGNRGSNSVFSTITSTGGGAGQQRSSCNPTGPGGSGGGGGRWNTSTTFTGNTPPVSPPQGNNGGLAQGPTSRNAGGGGGASAVGGTGSGCAAGAGGAGISNSITGSPVAYAGGGGGGGVNIPGCGVTGTPGAGGTGGGGAGGGNPGDSGGAGTANTGGGSGGASAAIGANFTSNAGGSGIVIIRYKFQ